MLPRDVEINESIATWKNLRRRHGTMLAPGAPENLILVRPQSNDMLVRRQRLLHRRVHVIALTGALASVERRQHARYGKQTGKQIRNSGS